MRSDSAKQLPLTDEISTPFDIGIVGGIPFQAADIHSASRWLLTSAVPNRMAVNVRLANAYNVALADSDPEYEELLVREGVNFPDGTPVVWFMNLRSRAIRASRVRGPSFFTQALSDSVPLGTRHFLLGGSPETLLALEERLNTRLPDLQIAGTFSPPYAPITDAFIDECAAAVRNTDADVVWIGLGTPKQDVVGSRLARELRIPTVNVGAAFDFAAETVREAPRVVQNSGLEWMYRLAVEPKRLWKRYLFGNLRFLWAATFKRREGLPDTSGNSS